MQLFQNKNQIITSDDFKLALKELGINKGDMLCVHTNFTQFGKILPKKDEFLHEIKEILCDLIGQDGTLIIPTFTYSFCKNLVFDKKNSKGVVGVFGEYFRHLDGVWRTNDPIFSLAVFGAKQAEFKKDFSSCFGKDSAFEILNANGAKFLMIGLENGDSFTYNIHIEQCSNVSYRYLKPFSGKIIDETGISRDASILYFVRDLELNPLIDHQKRLEFLLKFNAAKIKDFSSSYFLLIDAKKSFEILSAQYKKDDKYFLKTYNEISR